MYMLERDEIFTSAYLYDEDEDESHIQSNENRYQVQKDKNIEEYTEFDAEKELTNYMQKESDNYAAEGVEVKSTNYTKEAVDISQMKYPKPNSTLYRSLHALNSSLEVTSGFKNFNWTKQYEKAMDQPDCLQKFTKIAELAKDFNYTAKLYGQIIINELCLPVNQKTIKPVEIGGIAGGSKYIVCGILFKFSLDNYGVYNYNDEGAMKAAAHELRGVIQLRSISPILTPMMCLIDYKGFRLIAMSLLKIDKSTLVYGSADGGEHVYNSCPDVDLLVDQIASTLNLKKHIVNDQSIALCGDIEIHRINPPKPLHDDDDDYDDGDDKGRRGGGKGRGGRGGGRGGGKLYVIDAARLFPPEAPAHLLSSSSHSHNHNNNDYNDNSNNNNNNNNNNIIEEGERGEWERGEWLYRQLRPELVRRSERALSSDAFSSFGRFDPQKKQHNDDVIEATKKMIASSLPSLSSLIDKLDKSDLKDRNLAQLLHENAVNVRKLGYVRTMVKSEWAKRWIFQYCLVRSIKSILYFQMRLLMWRMKVPRDEIFKSLIVSVMNLLFGNIDEDKSDIFWEYLKDIMEQKYPTILSADEKSTNQKLREKIHVKEFFIHWKKVMPQIRFAKDIREAAKYTNTVKALRETIFVLGDVERILPRLKQMDITYAAEATSLSLLLRSIGSKSAAMRLRQRSLSLLSSSLSFSSFNFSLLLQYSSLLLETSKFETSKSIASVKKALQSLESAALLQPDHADLHLYFAIAYLSLINYTSSLDGNKLQIAADHLALAYEKERRSIHKLIKGKIAVRKGGEVCNSIDRSLIFFLISQNEPIARYFTAKLKNHQILADINFYNQTLLDDSILSNLIKFGVFDHTKRINLSGCHQLTESALQSLSSLPNLEDLDLSNISSSPFSISFYRSFTKLRRLVINGALNKEIIQSLPQLVTLNGNSVFEFNVKAETILGFGVWRSDRIYLSTSDPDCLFCFSFSDGLLLPLSSLPIKKEGEGAYVVGAYSGERVAVQAGKHFLLIAVNPKSGEMSEIADFKSPKIDNIDHFQITDEGIYSVGNSHGISSWCPSSGKLIFSLKYKNHYFTSAKIDDVSRRCFAADDATAFILDFTGKLEKEIKGRNKYINDIAITDDKLVIISNDEINSVQFFKSENGAHLFSLSIPSPELILFERPYFYIYSPGEIGVYDEKGERVHVFSNIRERIYSKNLFSFNGILAAISTAKSTERLQLFSSEEIMIICAIYSREVVADYIARFPSSLSAIDFRGYTALHVACRRYNLEIISLLCDHNLDPSIPSKGNERAFDIISEEFSLRCEKLAAQEKSDVKLIVDRERKTDLVLQKMEAYCNQSFVYKSKFELYIGRLLDFDFDF